VCQVQQRLTVSDRPNLDARLQARGWISEPILGAQIHWFAGCWWTPLSAPCSDPKVPLVSQIPRVDNSMLFHIPSGYVKIAIENGHL
jgi:hypothetical protein